MFGSVQMRRTCWGKEFERYSSCFRDVFDCRFMIETELHERDRDMSGYEYLFFYSVSSDLLGVWTGIRFGTSSSKNILQMLSKRRQRSQIHHLDIL